MEFAKQNKFFKKYNQIQTPGQFKTRDQQKDIRH